MVPQILLGSEKPKLCGYIGSVILSQLMNRFAAGNTSSSDDPPYPIWMDSVTTGVGSAKNEGV